MGWERPPLTVTQAHKWWESDSSLVLASKDISVKVIRGKGGYYCKPRGQVWAEPVWYQTRERISTNGCISKTSCLAILTNMLVSDLMWFLIPHALPLKRQQTRHYQYLIATSVTLPKLYTGLGAKQTHQGPVVAETETVIITPQSQTHQGRSSFVACDWPAEMEKWFVLFLYSVPLAFVRSATWYLEGYFFPAFQTDGENIQEDILQIWVKVIFQLLQQLQEDFCAPSHHQNQRSIPFYCTEQKRLWNVSWGQNDHVSAF